MSQCTPVLYNVLPSNLPSSRVQPLATPGSPHGLLPMLLIRLVIVTILLLKIHLLLVLGVLICVGSLPRVAPCFRAHSGRSRAVTTGVTIAGYGDTFNKRILAGPCLPVPRVVKATIMGLSPLLQGAGWGEFSFGDQVAQAGEGFEHACKRGSLGGFHIG